jgi:hypothetical protein
MCATPSLYKGQTLQIAGTWKACRNAGICVRATKADTLYRGDTLRVGLKPVKVWEPGVTQPCEVEKHPFTNIISTHVESGAT